jgi:putative PIN family toxin of toxin-antitoxin system
LRIVLDTNVLLAAFATHGLCEALFGACLVGHELVTSEHILDELQRNLRRKFRIPARRASELVAFVREHAEMVVPAAPAVLVSADADDLPVLGTAVAGRCDLLVTGDAELVALGSIEGIPIVTPRDCYERLVEE